MFGYDIRIVLLNLNSQYNQYKMFSLRQLISLALLTTNLKGQEQCNFDDPGELQLPIGQSDREITILHNANLGDWYIRQPMTSTNGCNQENFEAYIYTYPHFPDIKDTYNSHCKIERKNTSNIANITYFQAKVHWDYPDKCDFCGPLLVLTTIEEREDSYEIIHASNYILLQNPECIDNSVNIDDYLALICDEMASENKNWAPSWTFTSQTDISHSFTGLSGSDSQFTLTAVTSSNAVNVCISSDADPTYHLFIESPGAQTEVLNVSSQAFSFDSSTRILTASSEYEFDDGSGSSYDGSIEFKLCVGDGAAQECDSDTFEMTYTNCNSHSFTIDAAKFRSPAVTYDVRAPLVSLSWNDSHVTLSSGANPGDQCGTLTWEVTKTDGDALDSSIFTFPSATLIDVYTEEIGKAATYDMKVKVYYTDLPTVFDELQFTIEVQDYCYQDAVMTPDSTYSGTTQTYNIRDPSTEWSPLGDITPDVDYCIMEYGYSIDPEPPNASDIVFDFGSNKATIFSVDSNFGTNTDNTTPVTYTVKIFLESEGGHQYKNNDDYVIQFDVVVTEPCISETLQIDPTLSVFYENHNVPVSKTQYIQNIWQSPSTIEWSDSIVTMSNMDDAADCGAVDFAILWQSGESGGTEEMFNSIFTFSTDGDSQTLQIYTDDSTVWTGRYDLEVSAQFTNFPHTNLVYQVFDVNIYNNCGRDFLTVTAPTIENTSYIIGSSEGNQSEAFAAFTVSPDYCPLTYSHQVSPSLPSTATISLDQDSRVFTFEASDYSTADTYTVTVLAADHAGLDTSVSSAFEVQFINPCTIFTLAPVVAQYGYDYTVGDAPIIFDLDGAFSRTEPAENCGQIVYSVVGENNVFQFDSEANQLTIETQNNSFGEQTYQVTITASLLDYPAIKSDELFLTVNMNQYVIDSNYVVPANIIPEFEQPLPSNITLDFSQGVPNQAISLGRIVDFESDQFSVAFPEQLKFLTGSYKDGQVYLKSEQGAAKDGEYKVVIEITETINGKEVKSQEEILVIVTGVKVFVPNWEDLEQDEPIERVVDTSKERPKFEITSMTQTGMVTIQFTQEMLIPAKATTLVNETALYIDISPEDETLKPKMGFSWETVSFSSRQMQVQMDFENHIFISQSVNDLDTLQIEILEPELFVSKVSFQKIEKDTLVKYKMPIQYSSEDWSLMETLQETADTVQTGTFVFASSNAGIQLAFSASLQLVWGLINSLQIVAHFPMLVVQYPTNAEVYLEMLLTIAQLDLVPESVVETIKEDWFGIAEDEEQSQVLEEELSRSVIDSGYDTSSHLDNNFMPIVTLFAPICLALPIMLLYLVLRKSDRFRAWVEAIKGPIVWNYFIRLTLETSFEVLIVSMLQMYTLSFKGWSYIMSAIYSIASIAFVTLAIVAIPIFLHFKRKVLRRKSFMEKYGSLVLHLRTKQKWALMYSSFFLTRRVLLAVLIIYADEYPNTQIILNTIGCLLQVIFIGHVMPFDVPWMNTLELTNEFLVLTSCYYLFIFSDGLVNKPQTDLEHDEQLPDLETKFQVGWAQIAHLAVLVSINLFIMAGIQIHTSIQKIKLCCLKRKQKKLLAQLKEQQALKKELYALKESDQAQNNAKNSTVSLIEPKMRNVPKRQRARNSAIRTDRQAIDKRVMNLEQIEEVDSMAEAASGNNLASMPDENFVSDNGEDQQQPTNLEQSIEQLKDQILEDIIQSQNAADLQEQQNQPAPQNLLQQPYENRTTKELTHKAEQKKNSDLEDLLSPQKEIGQSDKAFPRIDYTDIDQDHEKLSQDQQAEKMFEVQKLPADFFNKAPSAEHQNSSISASQQNSLHVLKPGGYRRAVSMLNQSASAGGNQVSQPNGRVKIYGQAANNWLSNNKNKDSSALQLISSFQPKPSNTHPNPSPRDSARSMSQKEGSQLSNRSFKLTQQEPQSQSMRSLSQQAASQNLNSANRIDLQINKLSDLSYR